MKIVALLALTALTTALIPAQARDNTAPNGTPVYQLGSGQRAGGPARELNRGTGFVYDRQSAAEINRIPAHQRGSGQRAGGPANELNSVTGGFIRNDVSVAEREGIPPTQLGSGQRAGGYASELN